MPKSNVVMLEDEYSGNVPRKRKQTKKEKPARIIRDKFLDEVKPPISAMNQVQKDFLRALKEYDVVVFNAPAGCGKSLLTMSEVCDWLKKGEVDSVTITRPAIPMGRSIGLLPGTLQEKYQEFLIPLLSVIWDRYGKGWYDTNISNGTLKLLPPEYARGMSIRGVMILDEAQGFHPDELYTMLTRLEEGGKLILIGDPNQSDIRGENGIDWLCKFIEKHNELKEFVKIIHASSDDIVRGGFCKAVVKAKEKEGS